MSSILSYFDDYKKSDIVITPYAKNIVRGKVQEAGVPLDPIPGIFYEGPSAEALISDRFQAEIAGVLLIDPSEAVDSGGSSILPIKDGSQVSLSNDSREFVVVHSNNVLRLDEMLILPLKERT